jgi:hypothetical protein
MKKTFSLAFLIMMLVSGLIAGATCFGTVKLLQILVEYLNPLFQKLL